MTPQKTASCQNIPLVVENITERAGFSWCNSANAGSRTRPPHQQMYTDQLNGTLINGEDALTLISQSYGISFYNQYAERMQAQAGGRRMAATTYCLPGGKNKECVNNLFLSPDELQQLWGGGIQNALPPYQNDEGAQKMGRFFYFFGFPYQGGSKNAQGAVQKNRYQDAATLCFEKLFNTQINNANQVGAVMQWIGAWEPTGGQTPPRFYSQLDSGGAFTGNGETIGRLLAAFNAVFDNSVDQADQRPRLSSYDYDASKVSKKNSGKNKTANVISLQKIKELKELLSTPLDDPDLFRSFVAFFQNIGTRQGAFDDTLG